MSKFIVDEKHFSNNPSASYKMNTNLIEGFNGAVKNGMTRLAMEYLVHIMKILTEEVDDTPKKAVAKKATAKKVAAKTEEEED